MKRKIPTTVIALAFFTIEFLNAQTLENTLWQAYGISFQVPSEYIIDNDSENEYSITTPDYNINVQIMEGDDIKKEEIPIELVHIAQEDQICNLSPTHKFELPQFYGVSLTGECESEQCLYGGILTKNGTGGFYISILYKNKKDIIPEKILNSFTLEE